MTKKNFEVSDLLDVYGEVLTEKQRFMTECYYNDDLSLAEIAANEGITRQAVRDFIKRAEMQMYDLDDKLMLCKYKKDTAEKLGEIIAISQKMIDKNECISEFEQISGLAQSIL